MIETPAYLRNARLSIGEIPPEPGTAEHRQWVAEGVLALIVAVGIALFASWGCRPPKPKPPTPPTPPPVNYHPELRLTAQKNLFVYADGHAPFVFRKVIACCKDVQGTGWPGLSESFVNFAAQQGKATMLHWRVGPFRSANEPEWVATGGGAYVEGPDGRADLTQFNQAYFDAMAARIQQAGDLGIVVEISLFDSWAVKTRCWRSGDGPCAWHPLHPQGNVQGEDHLSTAWRTASLDAVQRAYVLKVLETVLPFGNVLLEDGTEADQVPGANIAWSLAMLAEVRAMEQAKGYPPHLYGSNFKKDPVFPYLAQNRINYLNSHDALPTDAKTFWGGDPWRPYVADEVNPDVPYPPVLQQSFACYAKAHGTYWTLWRAETSAADWNAMLALVAADACTPQLNDGCPWDVPTVGSFSVRKYVQRGDGWQYDATPMALGRAIRPEGDASRILCEAVACGLAPGQAPSYALVNATGNLALTQRPNPFQVVISGHGTATLRCVAPATGNRDLCGGFRIDQ